MTARSPSQRHRSEGPTIPLQRDISDRDEADPLGTLPRRVSARSTDGRRWDLLSSSQETVATMGSRPVAGASIQDTGDRVVVEFWTSPALPYELRQQLVAATFSHPAIRARRPVLLCLPRNDSDVLTEVRSHLDDPRSHVAGTTCLIEGHVADRGHTPTPTPPTGGSPCP